jgi:hypothetical protein
LLPLQDVAPDWVHPINGLNVRALLSGVDRLGVSLLAQ